MKPNLNKVDGAGGGNTAVVSVIEGLPIFPVRGRAVVLDSDLAAVNGVATGEVRWTR